MLYYKSNGKKPIKYEKKLDPASGATPPTAQATPSV